LLKVVSHFALCAFCFKRGVGQQGTDDSIGNRSERYHCNTPLYFYDWVFWTIKLSLAVSQWREIAR